MHKIVKWSIRGLLGVLGVAVFAFASLYLRSEWILGKEYSASGRDLAVPDDPAALALGEKVARTRGCVGCHMPDGSGQEFINDPMLAVIAAPNLTRLVHERSVAELDRGIRQGVRADGRSVIIMPSGMFQNLSDREFTALIAYLRSLPVVEKEPYAEPQFGPLARLGIALGKFHTERQVIGDFPSVAPDPDDPLRHGHYLVTTTCTECHGVDLHGGPMAGAPSLSVAAAYLPENFRRLMREGIPQGDNELDLMQKVAIYRFAQFSDDEIAAMHAYLSSPEFLATVPAQD